jgi:hypothetical protein
MNTERLRARASVLVAPAIAVLIAGEWLRRPGLWAAVGAGVVALAVAVVLWRAGSARGRLSAVLLAGVALAIGVTAARQDRVERHWGVTQAMLIDSAFQPVGQMLGDAKDTARVVAVQALRAARLPPAGAFSALRAAVRTNGPEQGVVLFDAAGSPRAWAGVQRSIPTADGPALQIRRTAFAFLLEVRRRDASGATALVTVLLSAKPTVLGAERSLAAQFEATRRAVGLPMTVLAIIFLVYIMAGRYMPDVIAHKGASLERMLSHQWLTTEGVFGVALGVSSSFIFIYVLFGALLDRAGAANPDPAIRSQAGDPRTSAVNKGVFLAEVLAAPAGTRDAKVAEVALGN